MSYLRNVVFAAALAAAITPASAQSDSNAAFRRMLAETGCDSKYSDDKKADLFATNYKGKPMTITGEIAGTSSGRLLIKVLPRTMTHDIAVELADRKAGYDLEKGQRVTVTFNVSFHGGCFLSYSGDNGVLQ